MSNTIVIAICSGLAALALVLFQHLEIDHLDGQVATLSAENTTITEANKEYAAATAKQNAAVTAMAAHAQELEKSEQVAQAKADQINRRYLAQADKLRHLTLPSTQKGDPCSNVAEIVNAYYAGAKP